jgi:hypothetical protein
MVRNHTWLRIITTVTSQNKGFKRERRLIKREEVRG